jgi:hypothetical protein
MDPRQVSRQGGYRFTSEKASSLAIIEPGQLLM